MLLSGGTRCQRLGRGFNSLLPFQLVLLLIQDLNMTDLHEKNCIPCRGGVLTFDISEIHKYLKKVDGWDVKKKKMKFIF